jgi:diguanylate cyclase (GGDEF)-like protein
MHVKALAALERLQGDAYAEQQSRGFRRLHFIAPMEAEYLAHMRAEQRVSTLICSVAALVIWALFMAFDANRLNLKAEFEAHHYDVWVVTGLRWSTLFLLTALAWGLDRGHLPDSYHRLSFLCLVLIGATAALSASAYKLRELPHADLAEFAIIVAVFLPVGMTFYQSAAAALIVAGSTALIGIVMLDPAHMAEHLRLSSILALTALVGAVGAYLREYAERDQFLLRRQLHYHAMSDVLTGIGNRRFFEQNAAIALRQAAREGSGAVLAILDVDHFKTFNDCYGHHAGDLALHRVGQTLKSCLRRPADVVARLGGEEFGLLLYGAGPEQAQALLEGMVRSIADLAIPHEASETAHHLTVSVGAACFDGRECLESLYRRADAALYASKDAGRNRAELDWRQRPLAGAAPRAQSQRPG